MKVDKASEKQRNDLIGGFVYDITLPLIKRGNTFNSIIDPKISLRYSPGKNQNTSADEKRIEYNNIFDLERIKPVEGGGSTTVGFDYKLIENDSNNEFLKLGLAQVFREEENKDLPKSSSIGDKSSDIFGNITLLNADIVELDYVFNLNNMGNSSYDSIDLDLNINRFVTSFEYLDDEFG